MALPHPQPAPPSPPDSPGSPGNPGRPERPERPAPPEPPTPPTPPTLPTFPHPGGGHQAAQALAPAAEDTHPYSARIAWRHRARQLCEERNLKYTAAYQGTSSRGHELFSVPTVSRYGREHVVRHDPGSGELHCDCSVASFGRPCAHAGAVLHWLDARAEAERPKRRAEIARELVHDERWAEVERLERGERTDRDGRTERGGARWV